MKQTTTTTKPGKINEVAGLNGTNPLTVLHAQTTQNFQLLSGFSLEVREGTIYSPYVCLKEYGLDKQNGLEFFHVNGLLRFNRLFLWLSVYWDFMKDQIKLTLLTLNGIIPYN